jgi:hypothetical protein
MLAVIKAAGNEKSGEHEEDHYSHPTDGVSGDVMNRKDQRDSYTTHAIKTGIPRRA